MPDDSVELAATMVRIQRRDHAAIARALSLAEDTRDEARTRTIALLRALVPRARVHRIGLTGPGGAGKSTLAAALAKVWRERGETVGILAVDPSSIRSGGALLGDRARMSALEGDDGVFVRSVATRGAVGGIAPPVSAQLAILSAAFDVVLLETTGVGQSEIDVARVVDTVVVVVQPGAGDVLQFLKAGVMEIPDVLVVSKADHEALARRATAELAAALHATRSTGAAVGDADAPVLAVSAQTGAGVEALVDALAARKDALLHDARELVRRRRQGVADEAVALLVRRHGTHALTVLGEAAARARAFERADESEPALAIAEELGEAYRRAARTIY